MKKIKIKNFIENLDSDKLIILFFNYSMKHYWFNPIMMITKLYYHFTKKPKIDHVCHISRWCKLKSDNTRYSGCGHPKIFEANVQKGMIENDLGIRLENFKGTVYAVELDNYDKNICKEFENEFRDKPYDIFKAIGSAVDDIGFIKRYIKKKEEKGFFCSYLVLELLVRHKYKSAIDLKKKLGAFNVAPYELFQKFYNTKPQIIVNDEEKIIESKKILITSKNETLEEQKQEDSIIIKKLIGLTIFLFVLIAIGFFDLFVLFKKTENENKEKHEMITYNYQKRENQIILKLSEIYLKIVPNDMNLYVSLIRINPEKTEFIFSDLIANDQSLDEIKSFYRNSFRKTFPLNGQISCSLERLEKTTYIPKACINFLPNIEFIEQSHAIIFENYVIALTTYKKNMDITWFGIEIDRNYEVIKEFFKQIKKEM